MLCCIIALGLLPATAFAEGQTVTITKVWEDKGFQVAHPEEVSIQLLDGERNVIGTVNLTAGNKWTESLTVSGDAVSIQEELDEEYANKYNVSYTEPGEEHISLGQWGKKVTPASSSTYTLQKNIVVAKKGHGYCIWTETGLTDLQKPKVIEAINNVNLDGLGRKLSSVNTEFQSGPPATFTGNEVEISEQAESNTVKIVFKEQKAWSLFYGGTLTITPAEGWIVTNTYIPETTDIPDTIDITVTKKWEHNGNNNAPSSVQVQLYADEEAVGTSVSISEDEGGNWQVTFEDLPKYSDDNTEIQYTVQEVNVPEGYESKVEKDKGGFVITNTYTTTSEPESKPIRDTVTIEIGNNEKTEEANPDTGAPLMFAPVMAAALAAAVVVKRKK